MNCVDILKFAKIRVVIRRQERRIQIEVTDVHAKRQEIRVAEQPLQPIGTAAGFAGTGPIGAALGKIRQAAAVHHVSFDGLLDGASPRMNLPPTEGSAHYGHKYDGIQKRKTESATPPTPVFKSRDANGNNDQANENVCRQRP